MKKVLLVLGIAIILLLTAFPPRKFSKSGGFVLNPQPADMCRGLYIETYNQTAVDGGQGGLYFGKVQKGTQQERIVIVKLLSIDGGQQISSVGNLQGALNFQDVSTNEPYKLFVCINPRRSEIHVDLPKETLADSYKVGSIYSLDLNEVKNTSTSMELYGCYTRNLTPTLIK